MIRTLAVVCLSALALQAADSASTPAGRWRTFDDKTGKPKAIVLLYEDQGLLFGRVETLVDPDAVKICDKCGDERKGQPVTGMVIVRRLKKNGDEYTGGDILDPKNGSVYRCKMRLIDQGRKLSVRGYLGLSLFGRSQTWIREDSGQK
ncbi:MAG: DUF2147 domain-containing protein [Bryobacteraceae bacterium]|jgi:uncharacterized protein (DUF2147 family)